MKVALITDTHFGARGDSPIFHEYFSRFYEKCFFPYLDEHKIYSVVHLGDAFDRRKYTNHLTLKWAHENFYAPLSQLDITLIEIVGNHDAYYRNQLTPSTLGLHTSRYSNVYLVDKPQMINLGPLPVLMLPWICDENREQTMQLLSRHPEVVMGHLELKGFKMYRGVDCQEGYDVDPFLKSHQVFSGHFHHRQTAGNVTYLGNPYEITWEDSGDPKGFHIYDTETRELEFVQNPFTIFQRVTYEDTGSNWNVEGLPDYDDAKGKFIKLLVKEAKCPVTYAAALKALEDVALGVQVIDGREYKNDITVEAMESETTLSIIHRYIDMKAVEKKPELNTLLTNLYHEASDAI